MPRLYTLAPTLIFLLSSFPLALASDLPNATTGQAQVVITEGPPPKTSYLVSPAVEKWIEEGHRKYYMGFLDDAIGSYQRAIALAPTALEAWLNGGAVLEERGNPFKAVKWFSKAALLSPQDSQILTDLGWAYFHSRDWFSAEKNFSAALTLDAHQVYALLGMGRVRMEQGRAKDASQFLDLASTLEPTLTIASFWKGQALEQAGDLSGAAQAYRHAANNDSYAVEARYALAMSYWRNNRFADAMPQFSRILISDPENKPVQKVMEKLSRLIPPKKLEDKPVWGSYAHQMEILTPQIGNIPLLRVGIGTSALGKPLPRTGVDFESTTPFSLIDAKSGHTLASGQARKQWHVHFIPQKPKHFDILNTQGTRVASSRKPLLIRPDLARGGSIVLYELPYSPGYHGSTTRERHLRGEIEVSLHPNKRALKIVNIVDLESYVNGVLSAEMPITSPIEALKVQSVVARSHAMYLKTLLHLHRKDGYDVCDGQHCQVYAGVQAESERSRAVVQGTRGRIGAYHGRVAHMIYSSNCAGHTQSSSELNGWGRVAYWKGIEDLPPGSPAYPHSPWELRWWLRSSPPAYCMPSSYVYTAHYRWTRSITAQELQSRINRNVKIGKLLGIIVLRRAISGHVNSVRIHGSRKSVTVKDESRIRNLLAPGSQRSALFFIETEYGPDHRPSAFVFHGGGWGHAVGMCQSGAAGRAERGALYEDILKTYYPGIEIGNLSYQ